MPKRSERSGEVERALTDLAKAHELSSRARRTLAHAAPPDDDRYLVAKDWRWAHELMEQRKERLLSRPRALGYGLGFVVRKGERLSIPCLTVFVDQKQPKAELAKAELLPKTVQTGGRRLQVDVVELGQLRRQVAGGDSIGPDPAWERGTLGAFARDNQHGDVVALTAMHINKLKDFPAQGAAAPAFDSPVPGPRFGSLRAGTMTGIDAAKVALDAPPASPATTLPHIGPLRGWRPITYPGDQDAAVRIFGATSGFQTGTVSSPAVNLPSESLEAAILAEIHTQDGDSGCALIDSENLLLGFLVGRYSSGLAVFTPASLVLARLGCDIPSL